MKIMGSLALKEVSRILRLQLAYEQGLLSGEAPFTVDNSRSQITYQEAIKSLDTGDGIETVIDRFVYRPLGFSANNHVSEFVELKIPIAVPYERLKF